MKTYKEFVSEANLGKLVSQTIKVAKKIIKGASTPTKNTGKITKV